MIGERRISSITHVVIIRWNKHNMSSYVILGVVYKQGTGNWKLLGMKMCWETKEEIIKCNRVKRQLSSRSQEDVTRRSPGRICRLWQKSGKEEDPWQNISLGNVSIWIKDFDAYRKMSWWKIITEVTFVLKVHMYMFIWVNLCRVTNHEKWCMILGDDSQEINMA